MRRIDYSKPVIQITTLDGLTLSACTDLVAADWSGVAAHWSIGGTGSEIFIDLPFSRIRQIKYPRG